jgi:F0F1-type ATP synthase assembly protein I
MHIINLRHRPDISVNSKVFRYYFQFKKLIEEIKKKELSSEVIAFINENIEELNLTREENLKKQLKKKQAKIITQLEKKLKVVPKNHYRNTWLAIGMSVFGIPLGVALGTSLDNMAFLGIGLPIGMAIGVAIGTGMDQKAFEEGKQLDINLEN